MRYYNETQEEYLHRLTKEYAKALSWSMKFLGQFINDTEIWKIAEKYVNEHYNKEA
jgi:hypothetical protein